MPGSALKKVAEELTTIRTANHKLAEYHEARVALRAL
jgi:hypothetical protein